jgi:3-isopropylmalate/(R)-2-methylmalate dehydratase small subunit
LPRAWVYGDSVDTDVIIPARYLTTSETTELARHVLEDLDAAFAAEVAPGDVVFAGANFGCGSSREHAPLALKGAGVGAVVAESFARIFFRNAVNTGLPVMVCPAAIAVTKSGDEVDVDVAAQVITNRTRGRDFYADPLPEFVLAITRVGGLVPWVRARLGTDAP